MFCNAVVPQLLWFKKVRTQRVGHVVVAAMLVNVGMWFERFVIIVDGADARFPAVELGRLLADLRGFVHAGGQLRAVPDAVPVVLPLSADGGDGRSEDHVAAGPRRMRQAARPDEKRTDYRPDEHHDPDTDAPRFANR